MRSENLFCWFVCLACKKTNFVRKKRNGFFFFPSFTRRPLVFPCLLVLHFVRFSCFSSCFFLSLFLFYGAKERAK